ncbi:hypothetical protein V1517DRAFT_256226 [Lipomyces orientalis]|uniref:Uncharacterized protein n=1 Tax=Lipomyces orientalis TaxID=1233043 RepID=A0ACC3TU86_9ASCO
MDTQKDTPATGLSRSYTERMLAKAKKRLKDVDTRLSLARSASLAKSQRSLKNVAISDPIARQASGSGTQEIPTTKGMPAILEQQQQQQQQQQHQSTTAKIGIGAQAVEREVGEFSESEQAPTTSYRSHVRQDSLNDLGTESRYTHADILRQIEDHLMTEIPLDFGVPPSSISRDSYSIGWNGSAQHSETQSMRRSTSEPVSINALTQFPARSGHHALPAIHDVEDGSETPTASHIYPIAPEGGGHSSTLTADMVNLLNEARKFRGLVTEMKEGLEGGSRDARMRSPPGPLPDRLAGQTRQVVSGRSEQRGSATSTLTSDDNLRMSQFSLGSIVTDRSSFRPSRAHSVVLAYGGQQPSSVYIAPLQAQRIATDIEEDRPDRPEHLPEADTVSASEQGHVQPIPEQRYPELGIRIHSSSRGQVVELGQDPHSESLPDLEVEKHRQVSNFSQRPLSKPRGPREFSGASSVDLSKYSLSGSPQVSVSEAIVESMRPETEPTAPRSMQKNNSCSSGQESSYSYATAHEYTGVPPELPRKNPVRPVATAAQSRSNCSSTRARQEQNRAQPEPARRRRPRRSNSAADIRQPKYCNRNGSEEKASRPYRERVVSTPVYDKPRSHQSLPSWFFDDETVNFSWDQPPGSEFDDIIKLGMEHKRILEKFIETLGKLSIEVSFDEKKRAEGRRRMDNALLALEGWI